ncbi:MAG: NADH-quinone oxidoreductase subunit C [Alicyclobacillus macrosporangiidus]|uniref:NADH-quinone oxidoreductase subunit C n=1 Tax=Alicyclobacillus macrosporangiidus TaxID=392015 RepID=UPI0026EEBB26|nr:NADH-quinone oxidoreductase subunit C [Alicyclobacillus macrosporangiidus]MCL6598398.1 NADH-quinone oxidoreductase subunit C [Alicyclobacillus macrosporangiidus]
MSEEGRKPEETQEKPATVSTPEQPDRVPAAADASEKPAAKEGAEKPAAKEADEKLAAKEGAEKPAATEGTEKPVVKPAARPAAAGAGAAAKKAPPPPDPRVEAAKAKAEQVKAAIVAQLGEDAVEEVGAAHFVPMLVIRKQDWPAAVDLLRTHPDWRTNYLEFMAGTDYKDKGYIEVVIYLQSTELGHFICLKTRTDRDQAEIPSLFSVFPGVNWEEREIYDLLGVTFTGHPDLRRIMMWDDFKGHPLRKDYNEWDERNA